MRFSFISDIHANMQAWNAVLEDIRGQNIKHITNLGDVVGYGPNPKEVLDSVRDHAEVSVIGNHDAVCAGRMDASVFNDLARAAIEWTRNQLDDEDCLFFKEMAEKARPEGAGFLATHAEVVAPLDFGYILTEEHAKKNFAACEDRLIFIGHTHRPGIFVMDEAGDIIIESPESVVCDPSKRYIVNPGSVGDPRSEDIVASYCIYDTDTREIDFRRVAFDTDAYRQVIDASSLTEMPFFIRYLDALEAEGSQALVISTATEEYALPQINLNPQMPVVKEKKNRKPLIAAIALPILIGIGIWAFLATNQPKRSYVTSSDAKPETTAKAESQPPATTKPPQEGNPTSPTPEAKPARPANIPPTNKFPVARYVRVVGRPGVPLHFAEVEVISNKQNVAIAQKATQSSTQYKAAFASRAVDGNRRGRLSHHIAHTKVEKPEPAWWEVDLGKDYPIEAITIYNREGSKTLKNRLNGCYIILSNEKGEIVYRMPQRITGKGGHIQPAMRKK